MTAGMDVGHCERNEAIKRPQRKSGLLRRYAPRNDDAALPAASASSPAPATAQHATGAQCSSGAYSGSFCRPPATAAIRAKVASASAENTRPTTLPSAPLSPIARAAEIALISMQPQAAPARNCATINVLRFPASSAPSPAKAPNRPAAPITINPPRRLVATLAGNTAILKPIQNTGVSHCRSAGF